MSRWSSARLLQPLRQDVAAGGAVAVGAAKRHVVGEVLLAAVEVMAAAAAAVAEAVGVRCSCKLRTTRFSQ